MRIHINLVKNVTDGSVDCQCIITEADLDDIEIMNEFSVSHHFKQFKKALQESTAKIYGENAKPE